MRVRPNSLRAHPNHHERGEEPLIVVTYSALARITGTSVAAVKKAAQRRRFNPRDLESVVTFLTYYRPLLVATPRKPLAGRPEAGHEAAEPGTGEQASRGERKP
jgi:hypothetical protein